MGIRLSRRTLVWLSVSVVTVAPPPLLAQAADGPLPFELLGDGAVGADIHRLTEAPSGPVPQVSPARGRGALWGAGIGLVAGGLLGGLTAGSDDSDGDFGGSLVESAATGEAVALGALLGAAVGAALGATVFAPSSSGAAFQAGPTLSVVPVAGIDRVGTVLRLRW